MYCQNCGSKIPDGENVCPACKTEIIANVQQQIPTPAQKPKKKSPVKIILLIVVGLILISGISRCINGTSSSGESKRVNNTYINTDGNDSSNSDYVYNVDSGLSESETPESFRANCMDAIYEEIARYPDGYKNDKIKFSGEVIQVLENGNNVAYRISQDGDIWYIEYSRKDGEKRILEGDYITCYGLCAGVISYDTVMGNTLTVPAMLMMYYDFIDNPAKDVFNSNNNVNTANFTTGQKNAIKQAQSYLNYSAFSREGLIHQLEYEQYTLEDATFAVDNISVDWMDQAVKKAKSYLEYSAFSRDGLIHQLEYEKFTTEEATYGADSCGADWMDQAVKKAKSYLEYSSYSKDSLIGQLEYEGFTNEQAVYGAEQNGY